jgi:uncharacterized protein YraI
MKILAATALFFAISLPATAQAQVGPASNRYAKYSMTTGNVCTAERGSNLSVRTGPGKNYRVLNQIRDGKSVILEGSRYGKDGFNWLQTYFSGRQGWVRADYICGISTIATD